MRFPKSGLAAASLASFLVKALKLLTGFLTTLLLTRILSSSEFGTYSFAFALAALLAVPTQLGLPALIVRETARLVADDIADKARYLWKWAHKFVLVSTTILIVFLVLIKFLLPQIFENSSTVLWGFVLVPLMALASIRSAALRGLGHVIVGQLPESIIRPFGFLALMIFVYFIYGSELNANDAMISHIIAASLSFCIGTILLIRFAPSKERLSQNKVMNKNWIASTFALGFGSGLLVVNTHLDIVIVGLYWPGESVAQYKVSVSAATLVTFCILAIEPVIMPRISNYLRSGRLTELKRSISTATIAYFASSAFLTLTLYFSGSVLLSMIFGAEYRLSYVPMLILAAGHVGSSVLGPTATILNMSGNERYLVRCVIFVVTLNIVLNFLLIPNYGNIGAASATSLSLVVGRALMWTQVAQRVGIYPDLINALRFRYAH